MKHEKSHRAKAIAALSLGLLAVAVCFTIIDAATTIATKGRFESILKTIMVPERIPSITKFFIFIPILYYVIFFVLMVLILILKERFVRAKIFTLAINAVVAVAAIVYI